MVVSTLERLDESPFGHTLIACELSTNRSHVGVLAKKGAHETINSPRSTCVAVRHFPNLAGLVASAEESMKVWGRVHCKVEIMYQTIHDS